MMDSIRRNVSSRQSSSLASRRASRRSSLDNRNPTPSRLSRTGFNSGSRSHCFARRRRPTVPMTFSLISWATRRAFLSSSTATASVSSVDSAMTSLSPASSWVRSASESVRLTTSWTSSQSGVSPNSSTTAGGAKTCENSLGTRSSRSMRSSAIRHVLSTTARLLKPRSRPSTRWRDSQKRGPPPWPRFP